MKEYLLERYYLTQTNVSVNIFLKHYKQLSKDRKPDIVCHEALSLSKWQVNVKFDITHISIFPIILSSSTQNTYNHALVEFSDKTLTGNLIFWDELYRF